MKISCSSFQQSRVSGLRDIYQFTLLLDSVSGLLFNLPGIQYYFSLPIFPLGKIQTPVLMGFT